MSGFVAGLLGDLIELKRGYDLPKQSRMAGNVPIVSSSGISDYHDAPMVKSPGVVTGRYGTLGQVFYLTDDFWPLNTSLYVRDFKGNDPRFVSYFLRSLDFHAYSDKAAVPGLNRNDLHVAPIVYPNDVEEQRQIAGLLGALDDKIELNRRMNETLEAMARTIFKDWFFDFGPTRAKMASRAPYLAPDIWKLFPDRLDEDGKPTTWRIGRLKDVLELAYGKSLPTRDRVDGSVPVYGSGGISGWHNEASVDGRTIIVGRKGTVGSIYWESRASYPIDTVFYVRSVHPMTYCLHLLESLGLETMNTDAAVPGLNRENAYRLDVILDERATFAFDALVSPMRDRMDANLRENETLAATRDLLLPKLMSGELRIRDAEAIVAAAA